jgi:hypothetical protein
MKIKVAKWGTPKKYFFKNALVSNLGSSATSCGSTSNALTDRYCGSYLGLQFAAAANGNNPICGN